jgi:serine/threonine-protein kinase
VGTFQGGEATSDVSAKLRHGTDQARNESLRDKRSLSMASAFPELKALGRYNIERTLGQGAMGVVYEGIDPRLGRRVAIKTILKTQLDEETARDYSARFVREAQAVARLNHPNIVQVYDFGEEGDIAYLVMEFIRGKELKTFFDANERFDLKEAVRIMAELCDALDFAHNAGIIHRDIKPANVMLDAQARTKLTDFGVARVQDSDKTSVERTQAGTMVGTPAYMSPEQITGGNIDKRTDVFSAGIILYQFLTGEKPFTGSGAWTIAKKIMQEEPLLPSSLNNAITPLFDAVVNKALAKNPNQRFQSARDLAVALKRALEGKPEEDDDKTVAGAMHETAPGTPKAQAAAADDSKGSRASTQEVELEFWRAIKDGNDPDDFELYVQQFPTGIYAALAKRKIGKLRGVPLEESGAKAKEQEKKDLEEAARREAEAKAKLEAEKARLEAEMARKEEEYRKREAQAEEKVRGETEARAKLDAEERAKRETELKARAEEQARQHAEFAKREADLRKRVAEAESKPGGKTPTRKYAALAVVAVLAIAGTGVYIQQIMRERDAAIVLAQHAEELRLQAQDANRLANEAFKKFQDAVLAENAARAAGDRASIKQAADARRKAEEDAIRQRKLADAAGEAADKAKRSAPPATPAPKPPVTQPQPPNTPEPPKGPVADTTPQPKPDAPPPSTDTPKPPAPVAATGNVNSFQLAQNLEADGKGREAVRVYVSAAKAGNCEAARRLGQIYEKGIRDVQHDYQESLSWYRQAEKLGCKIVRTSGRGQV